MSATIRTLMPHRIKDADIQMVAIPKLEVIYELTKSHYYLCRVKSDLVVLRFEGMDGPDNGPLFLLAEDEPDVVGRFDVLPFVDMGTEYP